MPTRHGLHRLALVFVAGSVGLSGAATARAATLREALPPLGIPGATTKPDCGSPFAPWSASDLPALERDLTGTTDDEPARSAAAIYGGLSTDLLPAATLCSPSSQAIPGEFSGTTAARMLRTRVGRGWREIGGTLMQPAPLLPGDRLGIPAADPDARLTVRIAPSAGALASPVSFTALSAAPATVTVAREPRGLVATLTRADGTSTEAVAAPATEPPVRAAASGTARRWFLDTHQLPGTVVALSGVYGSQLGTAVADTSGLARLTVRPSYRSLRPRRSRQIELTLVAVNRDAMRFRASTCELTLRRERPTALTCGPPGIGDYLAAAERAMTQATAPATRRVQAARAPRRARAATASARARSAAPIDVRRVTRSPMMLAASLGGIVPLAADVNGDGQTDFWTSASAYDDDGFDVGATAGTLLASGPSGLQPHPVQLGGPGLFDAGSSYTSSEISAINDITGDGIGELVVDLGERHALLPGQRSWGEGDAAIITPDPGELDASEFVLQPSASSPGAPYAALDDVTGDGRRELAATDDTGTWQSIASERIVPGRTLRLATIARSVPAPSIVVKTRESETTAPRFDPRMRVIGGQAIGLSWPTLATSAMPVGTVTIAVRDARGSDVVAPVTATVPGNALLLDHDRRSGDTLLLAVTPQCVARWSRALRAKCQQTVVRVGADGATKQTLRLTRIATQSDAPQTARFFTDGPDTDDDVEIVLADNPQELSVVASTQRGVVPARAFARAAPAMQGSQYFDGWRFYPVVAPDGARRVYAILDTRLGRYGYRSQSVPVELVWK